LAITALLNDGELCVIHVHHTSLDMNMFLSVELRTLGSAPTSSSIIDPSRNTPLAKILLNVALVCCLWVLGLALELECLSLY
jgi:hypothetical protein